MTEHGEHHHTAESGKADCGCGCNGAGDCAEAGKPSNKARRALMAGAGTLAFVATLANRRAFAEECGPISHAASMSNSPSTTQNQCGGLTPGYWKTRANVVETTLGADPGTTTLGSLLPNLSLFDIGSAGTSFKDALACNSPSLPGYHWAAAILNALSPSYNPSYGYTITTLNAALLTASKQGISEDQVLLALCKLENDYNTAAPGGPTVKFNCK